MFDEIRSDEEIDDRLIREAEAQMLRQSMEKLRDRDRDLLRMKYFEMRTDAEIAGELGIAAASVRYYLTLARRALLEEMKKYDE